MKNPIVIIIKIIIISEEENNLKSLHFHFKTIKISHKSKTVGENKSDQELT